MENKLGFIQIICSLWLFDQCGGACNHKIRAGIATNIYDMDVKLLQHCFLRVLSISEKTFGNLDEKVIYLVSHYEKSTIWIIKASF